MTSILRPQPLKIVLLTASLLATVALAAPAAATATTARVSPSVVTPDGDRKDDVAIVSVRLRRTSVVSTTVHHGRRTVARLRTVRMRPGLRAVRWGARGVGGKPVAPGSYRVRMLIREPRGSWRIVWATVRVARPAPPAPETPPVDPNADPAALQWPLVGTLTSTFGMRSGRMHYGIDIVAAAGTPVGPAMAGTVESRGWVEGFGLTVVVRHADGTSTLYAHLSRMSVVVGSVVEPGRTIGYVGRTGSATTDHLHLELHDAAGAAVDPVPMLPALPG